MKEIGLNLYSIRNLIATEEDYLATTKKLKEMGYSYFQYSGAPFDPQRIKRVCEETGTSIRLTHMDKDRLINETEKVIEENLYFGNKNIGLGAMSWDTLTDESKCKEYIEKYNKVGEIMQKNGCKFFWHHHNFEFIQFANGQPVFDYIIENAPHINYTLDTYWLQLSGVNVLEYLEKLKGRIGCVHLKDYKTKFFIDEKEIPRFVPEIESVGYGVMNFQSIIDKMREVGVENYFVEQDNAADLPDTLAQVERSVKYLQKEIK
ncbi:MAG: sugar phosphate isomerase/epimerase [Clostridia bacterium]|nr:sugar phosphate isomerase/epimerase [Clostridia bacterium]